MPLVSAVLNMRAPRGSPIVREADMWTDCPACGATVHLNDATVDQTDPLEVTYSCPECGEVMLIVSTPGVTAWEGRGYRMGDWMIRNPSDLYHQGRTMVGPALYPASPHALD
jgi:predicted RNA-binding Zn-ribbon protein involved in translation (DUF1610 family)